MANKYAVTNKVEFAFNDKYLEGWFKVDYSKFDDSYKYKLRISIPNQVELGVIDYETSNTLISLSDEILDKAYKAKKNTSVLNLGFAIETWNSDGTKRLYQGNEVIEKVEMIFADPIFTNFEYYDDNSYIVENLTGNNQDIVSYYSSLKVVISTTNKAQPRAYASIVKYQINFGDETIEVPYSEEEIVIDIGQEKVITDGITVFAIDSRGLSTAVEKKFHNFIDYKDIKFNKSNCYVERTDDGNGNQAILNIEGYIWEGSFGLVNNSVLITRYWFKKTTEDDTHWIEGTTDITPTISDNKFIFNGLVKSNKSDYTFDIDASYDFKIDITDRMYGDNYLLSTPLLTTIPNISINDSGVGIMCNYDENLGGLLQVGGEVIGGSSGGTVLWRNANPSASFSGNVNLSSDDYDLLEFYFYKGTDSATSVHSTKIIKGYGGQIAISGTGVFGGTTYNSVIRRNITRNSDTQYNISTALYRYGNSNSYAVQNVLIPMLIIGYKL